MCGIVKRNLNMIGIAAVCFAFLQNGAMMVAPLMANIIEDFAPVPSTVVILIQSIPSLGMVVGSLLYGALTRVLPDRLILIIATVLYAIAGLAPLFMGYLIIPILTARVFMGFGCGLFAAMSVTLVAGNFDERRSANYMGLLIFAQSIAMIVFQTGGGFLGNENWRGALLLSLLSLPILMVGLISLPKQQKASNKAARKMITIARKSEIKAIPFTQKYPAILICWCIEMFFFYAGVFVLFFNTSILVDSAGFGGPWEAVLVLNIHTGSGLVFSLVFGKLFAKAREFMLFFATFIAMLAFACFAFAQNVVMMCIGAGLLGFSVPSFAASVFQLISVRIPSLIVATATSMTVAFQQLGGLCMAYYVQPLCTLFNLDFTNGRDPFLVYIFIYGLLTVAVLVQALQARYRRLQIAPIDGH